MVLSLCCCPNPGPVAEAVRTTEVLRGSAPAQPLDAPPWRCHTPTHGQLSDRPSHLPIGPVSQPLASLARAARAGLTFPFASLARAASSGRCWTQSSQGLGSRQGPTHRAGWAGTLGSWSQGGHCHRLFTCPLPQDRSRRRLD
jgi:hypothetical protein